MNVRNDVLGLDPCNVKFETYDTSLSILKPYLATARQYLDLARACSVQFGTEISESL
jgi:hypothetical protein